MNINQEFLKKCFPKPPTQGRVGRSPETYLRELGVEHINAIKKKLGADLRQMDRQEVWKICHDPKIDVLDAYAITMAWGGQNMAHFRTSVGTPNLRKALQLLRESKETPKDDFLRIQMECRSIQGLGISFFTKLLFFFRPKPNAYILDQWTAKSAKMLFDPPVIQLSSFGLPHPDTSAESYEKFCQALESLGKPWGWSGENVECAIFDRRGGDWRLRVQSTFPDTQNTGQATRQKKRQEKGIDGSRPYMLGVKIITAHESALQNEVMLPGSDLYIGNYDPYRIVCGSIGGIFWQYHINQNSVRVDVFFPNQNIERYDLLRKSAGITGHDWGGGIIGNGDKHGKTRSITIVVREGANSDQLEKIAEDSVVAMNQLYERIAPLL